MVKFVKGYLRPDYFQNLTNWTTIDSIFSSYRFYDGKAKFADYLHVWCSQFSKYEVELMEEFFFENLLYISEADIDNCSRSVYPKLIEPMSTFLANTMGIDVNVIVNNMVILGLSDGARLDLVRYYSEKVDNYHFSSESEVSDLRCNRIIKKCMKSSYFVEDLFTYILIDDFSGSGHSYLRYENGKWKGKLVRFVEDTYKNMGVIGRINVIISPYYCSQRAMEYLVDRISIAFADLDINWYIRPLYGLNNIYVPAPIKEIISSKYMENPIVDPNYMLGKHDEPYLGFNESCLCTVFYHNTPNNTLPILWHGEKALFPRRNRHKY